MLPTRTYSVTINYDWQALYERIWRPEFFRNGLPALSNPTFARRGKIGWQMVRKVPFASASRPTICMV